MVASITGNTYKIAEAFKHAFDKLNWSCDIVRIDNTTNFKKIRCFLTITTLWPLEAPLWQAYLRRILVVCSA